MKPRFEPDIEPARHPIDRRLIDPEAYDACEQQFAASLEAKPLECKFVVDEPKTSPSANNRSSDPGLAAPVPLSPALPIEDHEGGRGVFKETRGAIEAPSSEDPDSWRREVAAKVDHYRANRRPRAPRYPSLQLKFESPDFAATARALPVIQESLPQEENLPTEDVPLPPATAKIIEFPVFSPPPAAFLDELAAPVLDRPRILEVPEVVPPPPALGGILIDPVEASGQEKRQGFELPLIAAPFSRRILAAGIDAMLVVAALAIFAYSFFRITSVIPSLRETMAICAGVLAVFWGGYEYLHLVHAGATPGLMLMKLRLARFDGLPAPRNLRRWRVLASLLSGLSLGLGYAWCFLDEDQLCWHDRITHTYMAPKSTK